MQPIQKKGPRGSPLKIDYTADLTQKSFPIAWELNFLYLIVIYFDCVIEGYV